MTRRARTDARKHPGQRRSEATVEAILEATARLLGTRGYEGTTTNRIAELAGTSVGSLYQYFPSKEAIMAALVERHIATVLGALGPRLAPSRHASFRSATRSAVAAVLNAHASDPALLRVLHAELPRTGRLAIAREAESKLNAPVTDLLRFYRGEMRVRDRDLMAFVLVNLVEGLTHAALAHRPKLLRSRRFREMIVDAVMGCVGAPRSPERKLRRSSISPRRPRRRGSPRAARWRQTARRAPSRPGAPSGRRDSRRPASGGP